MKKKFFSIIMILILIFGMIPASSFGLSDGLHIEDSDADPVTELPSKLENGQLWVDKSVVDDGNGEFTITLKAIGQDYKIENPLPRELLDVVLVLDVSGSMGSNNRLSNMKSAARNAVDTLLGVIGNRVAIVKYSDMASTELNFSTNSTNLKNRINGLSSSGGTNIQNAFFKAQEIIEGRSDKTRKPVIILMSDGEPTYYHSSLTNHSGTRFGNGNVGSTTSAHVWNTILQAMHAKNNIPNLSIYTIGFGVGNNNYAIATLMPTEANTSSYRPNVYNGQVRETIETGEYRYRSSRRNSFSPWSDWELSSPIQVRNKTENVGNWEPFSNYSSSPSNVWSTPTKEGNVLSVQTNGNNRTGYFKGSRTYTEYRNITSSKEAFNHKYWEDLSSITSDGADAIMEAFVSIVNELTSHKPMSKDLNDNYSNITIVDELGSGFEVLGNLPAGLTQDGNTITWIINGNNFETMDADSTSINPAKVHSKSFKVKVSDSVGVGTYYTNTLANGNFNVSEENPFFNESGDITQELANKGWLTITAPDIEATINITKVIQGPVSNEDRTFSFNIYDSLTNGNLIEGPVNITINGAGSATVQATISVPYSAFNVNNQATFFVQENEQNAPNYWTYDNGTRKPVVIKRANPIGAVSFTNKYEPKGTLVVKKAWTRNGPHSDITFKLQREKYEGKWINVSEGHTITSGNTQGITLSNLKLGVKYRVVEDFLQDYTPSYSEAYIVFSGQEIEKEITITNTYKTPVGKITINKIWDDNNDFSGDRPEQLVFNVAGPNNLEDTFTLVPNENGQWVGDYETQVFGTYTFTEVLPRDYSVDANPKSQTINISPVNARNAELEFSNSYIEPKGTLTINKVWDDNNDTRFRPALVELALYKDGVQTEHTITLPESDETPWSTTLTGLEFGTYTVEEIVVDDYTVSYSSPVTLSKESGSGGIESRNGNLTVTNTFNNPKGSITINKTWVEGGVDEEVVRPASITINLLKNGTIIDSVNLQNGGTHTFEGLDLDGSYTVTETAEGIDAVRLANYEASISYNNGGNSIELSPTIREGSVALINTYAKGTITIIKNWIDGNNPIAERPESATISLYQVKEVPVENEIQFFRSLQGPRDNQGNGSQDNQGSQDGEEQGSQDNQDNQDGEEQGSQDREGQSEQYYSQRYIKAFSISSLDNQNQGNQDSQDNQGSQYQESEDNQNQENEDSQDNQEGQDQENKDNQDSQDQGSEDSQDNQEGQDQENGDNKDNQDQGSHDNQDNENQDNQNNNILDNTLFSTFNELLGNETETIVTLIGTRTINRGSTAVFYNLEMGDNISYYIEEDEIPFYSSSISKSSVVLNSNNQNDQIEVTNTYTSPKGSLTVNKEWVHGNNPNTPNNVTVKLFKNGEFYESATFSESHTFNNLDLGATYTIHEDSISNYEVSYGDFISYTPVKGGNSVASASATITNTYIPERGNLEVIKEWVGQKGSPVTITIRRSLGQEQDLQFVRTVELNDENQWKHTFVGLEVYGTGGMAYNYTAAESGEELSLYTIDNPDSPRLNTGETSEIKITNTYSPEKGILIIQKEWIGLEEEEIDPPTDEIQVRLLVNGEPEEVTMILNSQNGWTVTRTNLNVNNVYSVEEVSSFEEFDVFYSEDIIFSATDLEKTFTITNLRTEDNPSISITKTANNPSVQLTNGTAVFNYTLEILNDGNRTLSNIDIHDLVDGPDDATIVYSSNPNELSEEGSLAPGETKILTYSITVNRAGEYRNHVIVTGYYIETPVTDEDDAVSTATPQPTTPSTPGTPSTPSPTSGNVVVSYVDENGLTLSPSMELSGNVGTDYVTAQRTIPEYTLISIPDNATGTFINGTISVVYVYTQDEIEIIEDEDIPEGLPEIDEDINIPEELELLDEGIPEGSPSGTLPKTGGIPSSIFYLLGSGLAALGIIIKKKD